MHKGTNKSNLVCVKHGNNMNIWVGKSSQNVVYVCVCIVVLGLEPKTSQMPSKHCTTELHPTIKTILLDQRKNLSNKCSFPIKNKQKEMDRWISS